MTLQVEDGGYSMEHVHHLLEPVPHGEGRDYPFFEPEELKDFGMIWAPRFSAMQAWSMAIFSDCSEVRMTQRCVNQPCFLPISMDEQILDMCAKEGRLIVTISNKDAKVLYSVLFRPKESLFDMTGLLDCISGVFDEDFIAKVRDMEGDLIGISMRSFAVKLLRLVKSLNGVRPKQSAIRRGSYGNTLGSQATPSGSAVTPRATPPVLKGRSPLPSRAASR